MSNSSVAILLVLSAMIVAFNVYSLAKNKRKLIHVLYAIFSACLVVWMLALCVMRFVPPENGTLLIELDAVTNVAASAISVVLVYIALAFVRQYTRLPRKYLWLLIPVVITAAVTFTNPFHHFHYRVFSIASDKVVFGPFIALSGVMTYSMLITAAVITLRYGLRSRNRIYLKQALIFSLGFLVPTLVNLLATLKVMSLSIAATPIGFSAIVVCHGIAIFYLNFLNIKPIALQRILDNTTDCYLIVSENGIVVNSNKPFDEVFGQQYGILTDERITDIPESDDPEKRVGLYNLLTSIQASRASLSMISYEQSVTLADHRNYYMVEITPLLVDGTLAGFVVKFKDVTSLREAMLREKDNMSRMMERERLASLGQMIGGIAHNLKTPIMSISGGVGALDKLVNEYSVSIGDPEITPEDHHEIAHDMQGWLTRIQDCCAYMSDLITTVKGLAANMNASSGAGFTLDELFKRVYILMQHELMRSGLTLVTENALPLSTRIEGDINNLVQVVNNLVSNAIDAMRGKRGENIVLHASGAPGKILLSVIDRGTGIPADIRPKLFREMTTSKGAMGTGLGLFVSNSLIKGKFGGSIWFEDNPEGGTIFNVSISTEDTLQEASEDGGNRS